LKYKQFLTSIAADTNRNTNKLTRSISWQNKIAGSTAAGAIHPSHWAGCRRISRATAHKQCRHIRLSGEDNAFGSFPNHCKHLFKESPLSDVTPHVLRHSFASIANDLGFTEVTIAALVGHSKGSVTSKYIHTLDTALIMAADTISGYIQGLLDGIEFKQTAYALDRDSRKAALARFLKKASGVDSEEGEEERRLAAQVLRQACW
jgi:hypothetical protein